MGWNAKLKPIMHARKGCGYVGIERWNKICTIEELHPYNAWQLDKINVQRSMATCNLSSSQGTPYASKSIKLSRFI